MEKNMQVSDEIMEQAAGGRIETDPYGFVCEATVLSSCGSSVTNGVTTADYSVEADNARKYIASWPYKEVLHAGERVQLIHNMDGTYSLEFIPNEG